MKNRVDIIGAGAIGAGLAVSCANLGYQVNLYGREGKFSEAQLIIADHEPLTATFTAPQKTAVDMVIVATKAMDVKTAAGEHTDVLKNARQVLIIQNGYDIASLLPRGLNVIRGIVLAAASCEEAGIAIWRGPAAITFDRKLDPAQEMAHLLESPWMTVHYSDRFAELILNKLLLNASINTLSAIYRLDCAQMLADDAVLKRCFRIGEEIRRIAVGTGISLQESPQDLIRTTLASLGNFRPTMLQDKDRGAPLEIAALVDQPLKLAKRFGVSANELFRVRQELQSAG